MKEVKKTVEIAISSNLLGPKSYAYEILHKFLPQLKGRQLKVKAVSTSGAQGDV